MCWRLCDVESEGIASSFDQTKEVSGISKETLHQAAASALDNLKKKREESEIFHERLKERQLELVTTLRMKKP